MAASAADSIAFLTPDSSAFSLDDSGWLGSPSYESVPVAPCFSLWAYV